MRLRQEKVGQLMNEFCEGNYHKFASELNVDVSHLYRYINRGIGGGKKVIGAVFRFCVQNGLDVNDYIEI